jgi:holo-[acyl-carrier protein] synthase
MIVGIGTDLIEISRISLALGRGRAKLLQRIGLPVELRQAPAKNSANEAAFWAARFAAKEAFAKAFGTGFGAKLGWKDIGIESQRSGKPKLVFSPKLSAALKKLGWLTHVSLSHSTTHATAVVLIEKR